MENWTVALRETYQKYPNFRDVAIQQQFGQLELLIDGEAMPCPTCGADAHFSAPAFCNQDHKAVPYLEQNIQPFGIKKPEPEDLFPARPAAPIYDWWQKLADQLQKKPLFLTGPGGMGKTTFLKFLYDSIKSRDVNLPFSCAFLLSLDTLMREPENGLHLDIDPLYNAEDSILLRRIACLAGAPQIPGGWKNIFTHEYCFYPDRPVLLMLDGLNEMRGQAVQQKLRRYHRILDEISSLSNRANYPNICIVVTSRIDRDNLLQDQKESLKSDFEHMCLGGVQLSEEIEDAIGQYGARRETMRNFLERPMYYRAAQELLQRENLPTTQFQLINIMYDRLCEQGEANIADETAIPGIRYIMKYLVPIMAYLDWRGQSRTQGFISSSFQEFKCWIPMIAHENGTYDENILDQINELKRNPNTIAKYLSETAQLIAHENRTNNEDNLEQSKENSVNNWGFSCHQDYRDFLVAKYFLQRKKYMWERPDDPQWQEADTLHSLSLNTYGTDIMHLIYQAVGFSEPPQAGEDSNFVREFYRDIDFSQQGGIYPGHILWYTTVYQLVDMCGLERISYGGENLAEDALRIFRPILEYVRNEEQWHRNTLYVTGRILQNLIEILMKCCEIYRDRREYQRAREIVRAASYIVNQNSDGSSPMKNVVDFNDAKITLTDFLNRGNSGDLNLSEALKKLEGSAWQGVPFRYACNTLAMLLVSPHPAISEQPEFLAFRQELLQGEAPVVCAFWLYYAAVFDPRKEGEDWLPRMYSLRQMLNLLGDHKVQIVGIPEDRLKYIPLHRLKDLGRNCIVVPDQACPIPSKENLILIERFLHEIEGFTGNKANWKYYLQGLIAWQEVEPDINKAIAALQQANQRDARAQLLLAFLEKRYDDLDSLHQALRPEHDNLPEDIGGYSVGPYYPRDITPLYNHLTQYAEMG